MENNLSLKGKMLLKSLDTPISRPALMASHIASVVNNLLKVECKIAHAELNMRSLNERVASGESPRAIAMDLFNSVKADAESIA